MKQEISVFIWNARGIRGAHKAELEQVLESFLPDVVLIQETKLSARDKTPRFTGYQAFREDRAIGQNQKAAGGLLTLVKLKIPSMRTDVAATPDAEKTELLSVKVFWKHQPITVVNVYNWPKNHQFHPRIFNQFGARTFIAGDFNARHPDWGISYSKTLVNRAGIALHAWLATSSYKMVIDETRLPTCTHGATQTRPDHILKSQDLHFITTNSVVLDPIGMSDHSPLLMKGHFFGSAKSIRNRPKNPQWNLKRANWPNFKTLCDPLGEIESLVKNPSDVNQLTAKFTELIIKAANTSIRKGCVRRYKPFWTPKLSQMTKTKKKWQRVAKILPTDRNRINSNRWLAIQRREINKETRKYWKTTASEVHSYKEVYRLTRTLQSKRGPPINQPLNHGGAHMVSDYEKAKCLGRFYQHKELLQKNFGDEHLTDLRRRLIKHLGLQAKTAAKTRTCHPIFYAPFSSAELKAALSAMPKRKAPGPDKMLPELIHHLPETAKDGLLRLFNLCWKKGKVPIQWKKGKIWPIAKQGKRPTECENLRPITLSSHLGKLFERIITYRLIWWAEAANILSPEQAGSRWQNDTTNQLLRLEMAVEGGFQRRESTLGVFIDLKSAFDSVWHDGLLCKLAKLGITGHLFQVVKDFLYNRSFQVAINNTLSKPFKQQIGVPQGSVISPLLFILFLNDLPNCLPDNVECALYADDIALWITGTDFQEMENTMNQALRKLGKYFDEWHLVPNVQKTHTCLFSLRHNPPSPSLTLNNQPIAHKNEVIYLGVTLHKKMQWRTHISTICRKANYSLNVIQKLSGSNWGLSAKVLSKLYVSLVRSVMEYASPVWSGNLTSNDSKRLERIQNAGLRCITGMPKGTGNMAMQVESNIVPFDIHLKSKLLTRRQKILRHNQDHKTKRDLNQMESQPQAKQRRLKRRNFSLAGQDSILHSDPLDQVSETPRNRLCPLELGPSQVLFKLNEAQQEDITSCYPKKDFIRIWTDASRKLCPGRAGIGFHFEAPGGEAEQFSYPANRLFQISDLELLAISEALSKTLQTFPVPPFDIVLLSDSKSSLEHIRSSYTKFQNRDLTTLLIHNRLSCLLRHNKDRKIYLQKVPAHKGIEGNELADKLAKQGSESPPEEGPLPIRQSTALILNNAVAERNSRHRESTKNRTFFLYRPVPNPKDPIFLLSRFYQRTIEKLRLSQFPTRQWLHQRQHFNTPMCAWCQNPQKTETVAHIFIQCPKYKAERLEIFGRSKLRIRHLLYSNNKQDLVDTVLYLRAINFI